MKRIFKLITAIIVSMSVGASPAITPTNKKACVLTVCGHSWQSGEIKPLSDYANLFLGAADVRPVEYKGFKQGASIGMQIETVKRAIQTAKQSYEKVYVMGYSAGGQLAVMASRKASCDGLILVSSPLDFSQVPELSGFYCLVPGIDPIVNAARDATPTLVIHGTKDPRCKARGAVNYYNKIASKQKRIILNPDSGHDVSLVSKYCNDIIAFINEGLQDGEQE